MLFISYVKFCLLLDLFIVTHKLISCLFLSVIDVWVPEPDHSEVPAEWWDFDADKSLLIGVFKHGK